MAFTYDPATDRGKVRMLITDRDDSNPIFVDAEIDAYLEMAGGSVLTASATALTSIATDQVLLLKKIKLLGGDLETDGPAVAKELRELAAQLRSDADNDGSFDIAEQVVDPFTYRDRLWKQRQRGVL